MISFLANALILCVIIAVLWYIATLISGSMPPPLQKVPLIIVAVVALILLLNLLGIAGQPLWHVRL
jgi:hypothetical protein